MKTFALAARNLLRNRRRSMATLLALALGAIAVLLFGGYAADIRYSLLTNYVQAGGHLQVQHKDYFLFGNGNPTAYGISDYARLIAAIRGDAEIGPKVRVVSPTLQFGGLAGNYAEGVSRTVLGVGYVAEDIVRMREWNEYQLPPMALPYVLAGAPQDAAVVGNGVARVLLLCERLAVPNCPRPKAEQPAAKASDAAALPDDIAALAADQAQASGPTEAKIEKGKARIELLATQPRGSPNVASMLVIGAEDQGFKELDEVTVILQLDQAQKLVYGKGEPKATAIMVQLERSADTRPVAERLRTLVERVAPGRSLAVLDFETLNPFYGETIALFNTIFGFIFVLIGAIVLFTVGNTMMAAVMERTTEIGTVRAVGLRQGGIRRLFLIEGFMLGCVGALAGVVCAVLAAALINSLHLTWLPPGSSTPLPLTVRVLGEPGMIAGTALGLVIIATLSAWLPAWRAARLSIVDALRHA